MGRANPGKPLKSVLVKPAGPDCQMQCEYCFYLPKEPADTPQRHRMSSETLDALLASALFCAVGRITFVWQGGEPTLMGLEFYRTVVARQNDLRLPHLRPHNSLQTNGLLIDDQWCRFLRENDWLVGLSLDGPAHVHDRYRRLAASATHERVEAAARRLLANEVKANAVFVVNDYSAGHAVEILEYLGELGFEYAQFIPCVEWLPDQPGQPAPFTVPPERCGEFLCAAFDWWYPRTRALEPPLKLRWFDAVLATYLDLPADDCTLAAECGNYLVVDYNGDVYPCDFYVEPPLRLGNVHDLDRPLGDLLNSPRQAAFGRCKSALPRACNVCPWLRHCRGGCPKDRLADRLNYLCPAYRMFFEHAHERLAELARRWKEEHDTSNLARELARDISSDDAARASEQVLTALAAPVVNAGRNDPCPCGSGRKYKRCCGRR